jgi:hypothetical protein
MRKLFGLSLIFLIFSLSAGYWDTKKLSSEAVVCVPVAEMVGEPLTFAELDEEQYPSFPVSWSNKTAACPRIHQLLFNEVVKVIERKEGQVKCQLPHVFYETMDGKRLNEFWTLEKNLCFLTTIKEEDLLVIPQPYAENFVPEKLEKAVSLEGVLTLTKPWFDEAAHVWYSAGTRFVLAETVEPNESYIVEILDYQAKQKRMMAIPNDSALIHYGKEYASDKLGFIKILKAWASNAPKKIPYVWGGCSCIDLCDLSNAKKGEITKGDEKLTYWTRPCEGKLHTGFDCSGLILRAAQACGMPYFFKNTTTILKHLQPLGAAETVQEGDIIWISGHVMVISDVQAGECIEARGYDSGYGVVQAIALGELFEDIKNFGDLLKAYKEQRPLKLLNKDHTVGKEIKEFKILTLKSIYH